MNFINNLKAIKRKMFAEAKRLKYATDYLTKYSKTENVLSVGETLKFEKEQYDGCLPIAVVSSPNLHCMTTFYDVEPISPCGKLLLVTNVPFIKRIPFAGEEASVCVINLESGLHHCVYKTKGWGAQLGANVQWGKDSSTVYCNDVIDDKVVGVKIDLTTLKISYLNGPIYAVAKNSDFSYSPNLKLINKFMPGYGVPEKVFSKYSQNDKESKGEGIWKTDLETGKTELFLSINDIVENISGLEYFPGAKYYIFHVKLNVKQDKLFFVLFSIGAKGIIGPTTQLIVYDFRSGTFKLIVTHEEWSKGGHHPNWMPNDEDIIMNLKYPDKTMRFVKICSSTGNKELILNSHVGGGHPSVDEKYKYLLTDAYVTEGLSDSSGRVPIRLININKNIETHITKINTNNIIGPCRIDPHPVWSKTSNYIVWNGILNGKRRVFVAESSLLYTDEQ